MYKFKVIKYKYYSGMFKKIFYQVFNPFRIHWSIKNNPFSFLGIGCCHITKSASLKSIQLKITFDCFYNYKFFFKLEIFYHFKNSKFHKSLNALEKFHKLNKVAAQVKRPKINYVEGRWLRSQTKLRDVLQKQPIVFIRAVH